MQMRDDVRLFANVKLGVSANSVTGLPQAYPELS